MLVTMLSLLVLVAPAAAGPSDSDGPSDGAAPVDDVAADAPVAGLAAVADGVRTGRVSWQGQGYRVVRVELDRADLRIFGQGDRGRPRTLADLDGLLERRGLRRIAATNGGIFHPGHRPVGLHVEEGVVQAPLDASDGHGNFYLKPNGVFWVDDAGAHVADAAGWAPTDGLRLATQSGPALVLDGAVHPAFRPDSPNRLIRSGVCVSDPRTVWLVLSDGGVRFHELALFVRDGLGCSDGLYLDGTISMLWADGLPDDGPGGRFASFLAVVEPSDGGAEASQEGGAAPTRDDGKRRRRGASGG